jgi:hypothetical protein
MAVVVFVFGRRAFPFSDEGWEFSWDNGEEGFDLWSAIGSRSALDAALTEALENPEPFQLRWDLEEKERFAKELASDPKIQKANDWSDL